MSSSEDKPGPSVQISAKAEATIGVQANIPEKSVGRLVDALTDIIRPFSEARGLKADRIRLQREDVAIEIARRAVRFLAEEGASPGSVPNKLIVPLLEAGSTEDLDDNYMIETWARLLATASKDSTVEPRLVGILREIQGRQAQALERIALNCIEKAPFGVRELIDGPFNHTNRTTEDIVNEYLRRDGDLGSVTMLKEYLEGVFDIPGSYVVVAIIQTDNEYVEFVPSRDYCRDEIKELDLEILSSLGVLAPKIFDFGKTRRTMFYVFHYFITELGLRLLSCCGRLRHEIDRSL